jgi:hypothetical protein
MIGSTNTHRRVGRVLALVASAAALAAPAAYADGSGGSTWPYSKVLPYLNSTGPAQDVVWPYSRVLPYLDSDGPSLAAPGAGVEIRQAPGPSGFGWSAFGIGIGAGIGALLIVGGVAVRFGKLRQLASA